MKNRTFREEMIQTPLAGVKYPLAVIKLVSTTSARIKTIIIDIFQRDPQPPNNENDLGPQE